MPPRADHYRTLRVSPLAGQKDIDAAFRKLAREYHPDVNAGPRAVEAMAELNLAYQTLGDPAQRREYDAARRSPASAFETPKARAADSPGRRSLYPPVLELETAIVEMPELAPGKRVRKTVFLKNGGGGSLSGTIRTSSPNLTVAPRTFEGNDIAVAIEASVDPERPPRRTNGYLAWRVKVLSNGGEADLTVRAPYRGPGDERTGLMKLTYRIEAWAVLLLLLILLVWPIVVFVAD